jgi:hypothetical protein
VDIECIDVNTQLRTSVSEVISLSYDKLMNYFNELPYLLFKPTYNKK